VLACAAVACCAPLSAVRAREATAMPAGQFRAVLSLKILYRYRKKGELWFTALWP
jgi:hypothetical protein